MSVALWISLTCNQECDLGGGLWWKVHAAQDILEVGVRTQIVEPRFGLQQYHKGRVLAVGRVQPLKSFLFLA